MLKNQNKVIQYIVVRPILDLCKVTAQIPGTWVEKDVRNRRNWT